MEMRSMVWAQGNEIFFFADFDDATVNEAIKLIIKNKDKKDLVLNIKSYGGYISEFRALKSLINKYNIRVHAVGYIMSAGFYLWCAAKNRSMEPDTELMYHELLYMDGYKTLKDHEVRIANAKQRQAWLDSIVVSTGGFTQEELDGFKKVRDNDYYFYYNEAVERGLITHQENAQNGEIVVAGVTTEVR